MGGSEACLEWAPGPLCAEKSSVNLGMINSQSWKRPAERNSYVLGTLYQVFSTYYFLVASCQPDEVEAIIMHNNIY